MTLIYLEEKITRLEESARKLKRYAPSWRHRELDEINATFYRRIANELTSRFWDMGMNAVSSVVVDKVLAHHTQVRDLKTQLAQLRWKQQDLDAAIERQRTANAARIGA